MRHGFGNFTYTYDTEGRMITAVSSAHTLSFAYDEEGRLATTTLDGVPTSYDYNGTMPMGDWTGTAFATGATETRQHVFGAGGEPLYLTVNGVSTYSHQDGLGSTIALSSATAGSTLGKITAEFAYDAFGQPTVPVTSTFGYAGQRVDPTTGLVYDRARFYSPALGRFYAPDPSGYSGGSNLYAYTGSNLVNLTDPSGLCAQAGCGNGDATSWVLTHPGQVGGTVLLGLAAGLCGIAEPCGVVALGVGTAGTATATITAEGASLGAGTILMAAPPVDQNQAAEGIAGAEGAANAANGARLAQQLTIDQASSLSTETGELTPEAIANSQMMMQPSQLANPDIPAGFAKFTTGPLPSPYGGSFTTRFYMNPSTGEVFYGLDYKTYFLPWDWFQNMKVRCVKLFDSLGRPQTTSPWLTIDRIYVVLTIEIERGAQWMFRLVGDGRNGVALFPKESFEVVSPTVASTWIASWSSKDFFQLAPERWAQAGFWERFYDQEPDAMRIFEEERKAIEADA